MSAARGAALAHSLKSSGTGANPPVTGQSLFGRSHSRIPLRQSSVRHSYFRTTVPAALLSGSKATS